MMNSAFETVSDQPMLLGECPLWHPEESALYWIDIAGLMIHRYDPSLNTRKSWPVPSEPGCIAWCEGGGLIVAMRSGIAILNTDSCSLQPIVSAPYDPQKFRFNDGRCDAAGRLWTGTLVDARDKSSGRLYSLAKGVLHEFFHPVIVSNGIAFNQEGNKLFHADTHAHRIMQYDFDLVSGIPKNGRIFKEFSKLIDQDYCGRPDGAAVDSNGDYWVAMYDGGRVLQIAPDGTLLNEIRVPFMCPTMISFGGHDLQTLFITSAKQKRSENELDTLPLSGYVISIRVDVPGVFEHAYIL